MTLPWLPSPQSSPSGQFHFTDIQDTHQDMRKEKRKKEAASGGRIDWMALFPPLQVCAGNTESRHYTLS